MTARPRGKRAQSKGTTTAITRGVAVSLALGKLACVEPSSPPPAPAPRPTASAPTTTPVATIAPAVTAEPVAPLPPDPSAVLAAYTVTDTKFSRGLLYTWTTAEQIDELLRTRVLLSRADSAQYGKSYYDRTMEQRWNAGDKIAALLRAPAFQKARFAWPAAWATILGWPGEQYGTELIEIRLKPEAWIAMFHTSTSAWEVRDLKGNLVATDEILKRPDRLAAVHFVHDSVSPPAALAAPRIRVDDGRAAYREYVLCNESMIESWSVGSEGVKTELTAGADVVEAAANYFAARPPPPQREDRWNAYVALLIWPELAPAAQAKELYEAALAFPNANYVIDPDALHKLAQKMRSLGVRAASTTHKPTMLFPGAKPVPVPPPAPPPKVTRKPYGTYY